MFLEKEIKCWATIQADEYLWLDEEKTSGINWIHHILYVCEQWHVDYRDIMTISYAKEQNAEILQRRCPCGLYMLRRYDQYLEYCWDCYCSKVWAQRGRDVLVKARLKDKGLFINDGEAPVVPTPYEEIGAPL